MFTHDGVTYEFHHLGIPTNEVRPGERFSAKFGMYTSDSNCARPLPHKRRTNCAHTSSTALMISNAQRALSLDLNTAARGMNPPTLHTLTLARFR